MLINKIQNAVLATKKSISKKLIQMKSRQISIHEVLCNERGGILDIALDVVIAVVVAVIILTALKALFNVNILPAVTDKITDMFS